MLEQKRSLRSKLESGAGDFIKLVQQGLIYVDKTLFVQDVLESEMQNMLLLRPRRWGKSLNLAMLDYFFSIPVNEKGQLDPLQLQEKWAYFSKMKIAQHPEILEKELGKYPVIRIDLSGMDPTDFEEFKKEISDRISKLYLKHRYLLASPTMDRIQKNFFEEMRAGTRASSLPEGIRFLSDCLANHFKTRIMVFIDEYDAVVNTIWSKSLNGDPGAPEFLKSLVSFLGSFYSNSCKGNSEIQKSVVTGVFRALKGSLGTAMNNFAEYPILGKKFSRDFGFTEDEIKTLLTQRGLPSEIQPEKLAEAKKWYNGYKSNAGDLYNPWSIMRWLENEEAASYWVQMGGTELALAIGCYESSIEQLQQLLAGEMIEARVRTAMILKDTTLADLAASSFWTLLVFSGFLTVVEKLETDELDPWCRLKIPNHEVRKAFRLQFLEVMKERYQVNPDAYEVWMEDLLLERIEPFEAKLRSFVDRNFSIKNVDQNKVEAFYQGFLLGLSAIYDKGYQIRSEFPTGQGYADALLIPRTEYQQQLQGLKKPTRPALILEYKRSRSGTDVALKKTIAAGFDQIQKKGYRAEIENSTQVESCLEVVIAFHGKKFLLKTKQWKKLFSV